MAQRRRDLEIAIKARDEYSAELRKAEGDISKFEAARRRTQQRRDAVSNAKKQIEETSAAYRRASQDAQRYAKALADATTADRLSAAEQRELRDAFSLSRDRARDLKKALAEQVAELHRLRGASQGTFQSFIRSAEAQEKEALASRQAKEADEARSKVLGDLQTRLDAARQSGRRYQDAARNAMQSSDPRRQALGRVTGARANLDQAQAEAQAYARALNEARQAGNLTEAEMEQLSAAFDQSRKSVRLAKQELLEARQALQATSQATDRQGDEAAQTATNLKRLGDATEEATADQKRLERQARRTGGAFGFLRGRGRMGDDIAQQTADAWATRQGRGPLGLRPYEITNLSYQINDVVSGLAMGQAPMQVFAQQAGQVIQIFPKMATAIFKLAPAIALLAPFALGLSRISREASRLSEIQTSLDMMADGAQYSATRLARLSEELDRAGASFKEAQATITALAGEDLSFGAIEALSTAALQLSQIRGSNLEDATQTITDAFSKGVEGVRALDAEIGFLTADQYELILSLQEAGQEAEALTVAAEALRQKTTEVAGETEGWAAAMNALGGAWSNAMDRLADSATIRVAARGLRELGEAIEFAASGLEKWLEQEAQDTPEVEIDVSLSDKGLDAAIKDAEKRLDEIRKRWNLGEVVSDPITGISANDLFGLNDSLERAIAIEERRIELLEEERRRREQIAQDAENQEKLQLDINQLVEKHISDLEEEARLAEMTKRERYIEEQLHQARNEAMERANELGVEFLGLTEQQVANIREMAGALYDMKFPEAPDYEAQFTATRFSGEGEQHEELVRATTQVARELGVSAKDLLAVMSFETGGTLDPWQPGPTTQWGQHRGLIQWGEPQRERYGVTQDMSIGGQVQAVGRYLADHGVRPGMGLPQLYAAVLAGDASRVNASDTHNGGVVASVLDSVSGSDFEGHIARAEAMLATYNDVVQATEKTADEQERAAERAAEFHERQNAALEQAQFELSLEDENLVNRQVALALREAELEAQEAGTQLTAEQREQIEATTRAKYQQQMLDEQRNEKLKEAKQLSAEIKQLQERQKFLKEERDYAASVGDEAGVAAAEEELLRVNEQLDQAIEKAIAFWKALGGPESEAAIQAIRQTRAEMARTEVQTVTTAEEMNNLIAGAMVNAFDRFAQRVAEGENALTAFKEEFMRMAAEVLIQIGRMILQQAIFNALSGMFGGAGGLGGRIAGGINSMFFHSGGIVGRGGSARMVPATAFAGAIRYHSGGMAGLKPDEVPAVLQKGEEVLTEDDPRHRDNMGGQGGSSRRPLTIVNAFDAPGFLESALSDAAGQEALVNFVRANKDAVKAAME